MNTSPEFTLSARKKSFRYAWEGLKRFLKQEHNARIHGVATVIAITGMIAFRLTSIERVLVTGSIAAVWITEMLNTCVEKIADTLVPHRDPRVKYIKDLAAGAVLLAALAALATAFFIFLPKIF